MTVFEREAVADDGSESIVRCTPITGRSHQIRVHLQWLGESFRLNVGHSQNSHLLCQPVRPKDDVWLIVDVLPCCSNPSVYIYICSGHPITNDLKYGGQLEGKE